MFQIIIIVVVALCVYFVVQKLTSHKSSISTSCIAAGLTLILSTIPNTMDKLIDVGVALLGIPTPTSLNPYLSIFMGVVLVIFGTLLQFLCRSNIIFCNFSSVDKSRRCNLSKLHFLYQKCATQVCEHPLYFCDFLKPNKKPGNAEHKALQQYISSYMKHVEEYPNARIGLTGMGPIPYTCLAGTYMGTRTIQDYIEYDASKQSYFRLKHRSWRKYPKLAIQQCQDNAQANDIVVAISCTHQIDAIALTQFNMPIVHIQLPHPQDNIIKSTKQLQSYVTTIISELEELSNHTKRIYIAAAIPSCFAFELGRQLAKMNERLVEIVVYNYSKTNTPAYNYGIYMTGKHKGEIFKE